MRAQIQVPIPELVELRHPNRCFIVHGLQLLPETPLVVPDERDGITRGDHVDIELVVR